MEGTEKAEGDSFKNYQKANQTIEIIAQLKKCGIEHEQIGICTFYHHQVEYIKNKLSCTSSSQHSDKK